MYKTALNLTQPLAFWLFFLLFLRKSCATHRLILPVFILNGDPPKHHRVKENSVSLSDSSKLQGLKCLDLWNRPDIMLVHVS